MINLMLETCHLSKWLPFLMGSVSFLGAQNLLSFHSSGAHQNVEMDVVLDGELGQVLDLVQARQALRLPTRLIAQVCRHQHLQCID